MRRTLLLLVLFFCTLLLFACQSQDEEMTLADHLSSISISKSDGYGGLNENYFMTIDEDTYLSTFEQVLKNAEGKKQKVDVANEKPDDDLLVRYENGGTNGLHLVLGNTGRKAG